MSETRSFDQILHEAFSAHAKFWIGTYSEARDECTMHSPRRQLYEEHIARYTAMLLCRHDFIEQSGTLFKCMQCGANSK